MGKGADALILILLDSNIYFSALTSPPGFAAQIAHAWRNGRFSLLTCQQQIDEIHVASRNPKIRNLFQPHHVGDMLDCNWTNRAARRF
jgi:predicted nucleic acid-binding protein